MLKSLKIAGFILMTAAFGVAANAQDLGDLGSSSGIFRSANPKSSSKSAPKNSSSSAKRKEVSKPIAKSAKSSAETARETRKSNAVSRRKTTVAENNRAKTAEKNSRVNGKLVKETIITVGSDEPEVVVAKNIVVSGNAQFEEALEQGNSARDERNYRGAENFYLKAQKINPRDSRAIYGLGNIFSDQQRWEEAEKAYRQAIQLEPASPDAHLALSFVLTQPVVGVNLSERFAEAEKSARRAVELDNSNAVAFDQLGVALELSGKIDRETREAYEKAIALDSGFALAYAHLGRLLRRNGLNEKSASAYRDAVRLASDIPTMILVADVMQSQQKYLESEPLLQRALREDPKNPTALFLLGRALIVRNCFDDAEKVLKRSVEVSPNSFVSYIQLSSLYARRGNYADAEKTLMRALNVVSVNEKKRLATEFETVGNGFMRIGRREDAVRLYRQAVELDKEKKELTLKISQTQKF